MFLIIMNTHYMEETKILFLVPLNTHIFIPNNARLMYFFLLYKILDNFMKLVLDSYCVSLT